MPLDDYTLDAIRELRQETKRMIKMTGATGSALKSKRRRKIINAIKRRFPGLQVAIDMSGGREVWRIKGLGDQEAEAMGVLKQMLDSQDELGRPKDPFQVDDLDRDTLAERTEERGALLELPEVRPGGGGD